MGKYILSQKQIKSLMSYLLEKMPYPDCCDGTLKHTKKWLIDKIPTEQHETILEEIKNGGGYCDCEVVLNCYHDN